MQESAGGPDNYSDREIRRLGRAVYPRSRFTAFNIECNSRMSGSES